MAEDTSYTVGATRTSVELLELLVDADEPCGVTRLSHETGRSKSVVHNHLSTLRDLGLAVKRGRRYGASLGLLALGERVRSRMTSYTVGREHVENLAHATGEVATLFVEEEGRGVPLFVADGASDWTYTPVVGERIPLHVTAPGKAILATMDEERVAGIVDRYGLTAATESTITDPDVLTDQLRRIRDDGVSFCREEQFVDIVGVAAPIRAETTPQPLALGVVGPMDRLSGRYLEEDVTGQVLSTANAVQVELAGQS